MQWEDLPLWFRRWLRRRVANPPEVPPGPSQYGGPSIAPAEQGIEATALQRPAGARRVVARVTDALTARPRRVAASRATASTEADVQWHGTLRPRSRGSLNLPTLPVTPPILADAPTFYARGEPGEPDLVGGRQIRAHDGAGHVPGVETGVDGGSNGPADGPGSAYRGGSTERPGDFHVDTSDGWLGTPQVSFEAWVKPATLRGNQSLLDARTVHRYWGDRWLWFTTQTVLGQLLRLLADILGDYDVLDDWPRWRGFAAFTAWRYWWAYALIRSCRHQMGWELHLTGATLRASFGTGYSSGEVFAHGVLTTGRWSHVAATCDGHYRRLYVDGTLVATSLVNVAGPSGEYYIPPVPGVDLVIGRGSSAAIDEVAVYDDVLTPERVQDHRAGLAGGATPGLLDLLVALPLRPVATLPPRIAVDSSADSARTLQPRGSRPLVPASVRARALPFPGYDDQALAFADAIADAYRVPILDVRADWYYDGTYSHPQSNLTDLVTEISIDRQLTGELPAEVGLVEGAAAAAMSVRIAGQWDTDADPDDPADGDTGITGPAHPRSIDAVAAFAPYNPDAPLFGVPTVGAPIRADLGFLTRTGRQTRRRFTGTVSRVNPSSLQRDVQIDGLDPANRMRAPITQHAVGMDGILAARYGPDRYNARINAHWLVDRVFRANDYCASPRNQPGSFIAATLHGSTLPEVGGGGMPRRVNVATPSNPDAWVGGPAGSPHPGDHPYGMMYANPEGLKQTGDWYADPPLTMFPGDGYGCSALIRMPSTPVSPVLFTIVLNGGPIGPRGQTAGLYAIQVYLYNGAPQALVYTPVNGGQSVELQGWQLPRVPTWMPIGFHWQFTKPTDVAVGTTNIPVDCTMTLHAGGNNAKTAPIRLNLGNVRANPWAPSTTVSFQLGVPMTNVSWFRAPIAPEPGEWAIDGHISEADVDPAMNELTGIPQLSGEDSWELVTEVAAAECATVGFSVAGRPYFRSRAVRRDRGRPEELTADRHLADLVTVTDEASVRNAISAAVTPLLVEDYEWVLESKDATDFEAGPGTTYFPITLPPDTVLVEPWYLANFTSFGYEQAKDHPWYRAYWQYCVVYAHDPSLEVTGGLVTLAYYPAGPGRGIVAVFNFSGRTVRFATADKTSTNGEFQPGQAAFRLPGRLLQTQATQPQNIIDSGSIALFGPRTHELGSSSTRWHQHDRAIAGVASAVLATTAHPAPVLDAVTVQHDPRRDLDTPVRLLDPHGLGAVRANLVGITTRWSTSSAAVDELTVRPLTPPGFGVLDDPEAGRVGVSLRFGA